jgi:general secretion pathway protein J
VLSVSTATPVHVDAPARSGNSDDSKDDAKDGAKDDGKNTGAAQKQGGS